VLAGISTSAPVVNREPHQRTITLGLAGGSAFGQVTGTVNDSYRACSAKVPVAIERFRADTWRWVATATTRDDGTYRVRVRAPRGEYRALVARRYLANGATCAPRLATPCVGVRVAAGADLRAVTRRHGAGTTFCLAAANYTVTQRVLLDPGDVISGAGRTATVITAAPNVELMFDYHHPDASGVLTFEHLSMGGANTPLAAHCNQGSCGSVMLSNVVIHATDVRCFGNATTCFSGGSHNLVLTNFECDGNGWHPDSLVTTYQSSACIKLTVPGSLTVRDSYFHDNTWDAIWCDHCRQGVIDIRDSRFIRNGRAGVTWEVFGDLSPGDRGLLQGNSFQLNGGNPNTANGPDGSGGHAGIIISDSSNIEITQNTFQGNLALDQPGTRAVLMYDGPRNPQPMHHISIHDNQLNQDRIQTYTPRR
jgi:hypothetical protein